MAGLKEEGEKFLDIVLKTGKERMDGKLSGPFFISLVFVFWEVPINLFSSHAKEKIDAIKAVVGEVHLFGWEPTRIVYVLLAWIFWVFLAPFLGPFVLWGRDLLIDLSLKLTKHESYAKIKNDLDVVSKSRLQYQKRRNEEEAFVAKIKTDIAAYEQDIGNMQSLLEAIDGKKRITKDENLIKNVFDKLGAAIIDPENDPDFNIALNEQISILKCYSNI